MKKVFLDELPRKQGIGVNKDKQVIDWSKSIGCKVKFIYEDIIGEVEIVGLTEDYLYIKYLNKDDFKIYTGNFQTCRLGKLLSKITNEFKIETGMHFKDEKRDLMIIDGEYRKDKNNREWKYYKYRCNKCGWTEGWIEESHLLKGQGCSCCRGITTVEGINDIYSQEHWMVKYFVVPEEAKTYTKASNQSIELKCPDCGRVKDKEMIVSNLYKNKSIKCVCGDGQSYPEKLMFSLLEQLGIKFETQKTFDWSKNVKHDNYKLYGNKIYDFYFKFNSEEYIIETHGLQHYVGSFNAIKNTKEINEEQENDKIKKELALENGIKNYIVIDCSRSDVDFIKNEILSSILHKIFDLSNINWNTCEEFALSNRVKEACDIKRNNPEMTTLDIANEMGLNRSTVIRYLKKGTKLSWCKYDPRKEMLKSNSKNGKMSGKQVEAFKDGMTLGIFESCNELERQSEGLFGVKLLHENISLICNGKRKSHKGFTFQYIVNN